MDEDIIILFFKRDLDGDIIILFFKKDLDGDIILFFKTYISTFQKDIIIFE